MGARFQGQPAGVMLLCKWEIGQVRGLVVPIGRSEANCEIFVTQAGFLTLERACESLIPGLTLPHQDCWCCAQVRMEWIRFWSSKMTARYRRPLNACSNPKVTWWTQPAMGMPA